MNKKTNLKKLFQYSLRLFFIFFTLFFLNSCGEIIEHYQCIMLVENGKFAEAIERLDMNIKSDPNNSAYYDLRGYAKIMSEYPDKQDALNDLNYSIELSPTISSPYIYRARSYLELEMYSEAIEDCKIALKNCQSKTYRANIYNLLGLIYLTSGDLHNALDQFNISLELNHRSDATAYGNRGLTYGRLGQFSDAYKDIEKAMLKNKKVGYKERGLVKLLQFKDIDAQKDFNKHLEFFPNFKRNLDKTIEKYKLIRSN